MRTARSGQSTSNAHTPATAKTFPQADFENPPRRVRVLAPRPLPRISLIERRWVSAGQNFGKNKRMTFFLALSQSPPYAPDMDALIHHLEEKQELSSREVEVAVSLLLDPAAADA